MRDLATGSYTAEAVAAALRLGTGKWSARFDVTDRDGGVVYGTLDAVIGAKVTFDVDRDVHGSLELEMIEDPGYAALGVTIRPYWIQHMPDGGDAEFPLGAYLWMTPERDIDGTDNVGVYRVTLPDYGFLLTAGGPGPSGFRVARGATISSAINDVLAAAGISEYSVAETEEVLANTLIWSLRRKKAEKPKPLPKRQIIPWSKMTKAQRQKARQIQRQNRRDPLPKWHTYTRQNDELDTTWYDILMDLHDAADYHAPWFNADGIYIAEATKDVLIAAADMEWTSTTNGIVVPPVSLSESLDSFANRVIIRGQGHKRATYAVCVADANDCYPNHPMRQAQIGFYVDKTIDDNSGNTAAYERRAKSVLSRSLKRYQQVSVETLPWPVHEAYDLVTLIVDGDDDLSSTKWFHEHSWDLDLTDGTMTHELTRIVR